MKKTEAPLTNFRLDPELKKQIKLYCVRNNISMDRFINEAVSKLFDQKNIKEN